LYFFNPFCITFALLRKAIAILFLSIYLFSATEFSQLLKLPLLVEHFIEHKEENKQITLWEFLDMHYAKTTTKDADYDKDMKLPFKSTGNSVSFTALNCLLASFETALNHPTQNTCTSYSIFSEHIPNSSLLNAIWQPPKQA
jgi:hypothetical protein